MKYTELIEKYTEFRYHGYELKETEDEIRIVYDFEICGLSGFAPTFTLKKPSFAGMLSQYKVFQDAVFSLGMAELVSYWKISCAPHVIVECGSLSEEQILWWKKLYFNGLGEFFYKNEIDVTMENFMDLTSSGSEAEGREIDFSFSGSLIPVGGGKDSFVSLDLLKDKQDENYAFVINRLMSAVHSANAAGYDGEKLVNPIRTLDNRMLELNKQGYLNGHTPFSALAAFAAYLTAIVYRRKYIVLSNESSANESTVKGSSVNHQYSKTFDFEKDFNHYTETFLPADVHYFSFLRPLSELQIAGIFASLKEYLPIFRSCNVGSKEEKWCGHCAKCLFVCFMMSAYLSKEEVISIFGRDMLNDPEMKELFEQLTGIADNKPFECVGTRDEVNIAISMGIRRFEQDGEQLPLLFRYYKESGYYPHYKDSSVDWKAYDNENLLPKEFAAVLKKRLEEMQ